MKQKKFMSVGLMLVIIGILWLLQQMGIINGSFWGYVLPVLLILFGLDLLNRGDEHNAWCKGFSFWNGLDKKNEKKREVVDEQ
ncbi:hypothetical protein H6761_02330 [Candidatus Nomurabacteria bacterium]|nr:hypothetical protein [Candidatus Nomurabacteria bacterium]